MNEFFEIFTPNVLVTGIIYGLGAIGLGLIYKYLKFPDFTTTISFTAGSVAMAAYTDTNLFLGFTASILIGLILGSITFTQIRLIRIPPTLAGIITWVGALSILYIITGNQADINPNDNSTLLFKSILTSSDNIWNLVIVGLFALFVSYLISLSFKTRYGLYILGMLGTPNYIEHRHKKKNFATFLLIVFGNGLISFSGAILTISHKYAHIKGSGQDFLIIALSGYVFAVFLLSIFTGVTTSKYLSKENKPSGKIQFKIFLIIQDKLKLNDEHPTKIFLFLCFIIIGSTLVQTIFQYIEINYSDQSISHLLKAGIFLFILFLMRGYDLLINYKISKP
jgi:ABC-type uncharacterized transport system permease subunit